MKIESGSNEARPPTPGSLRRWLKAPSLALPGGGFESTRYLAKWLLLSTVIGLVAGLGAIAFYLAIQWATDFFLGRLVGYLPPAPVGEGSTGLLPIARPWLLPLAPPRVV